VKFNDVRVPKNGTSSSFGWIDALAAFFDAFLNTCDVRGNISDVLVNICGESGNISDALVNICGVSGNISDALVSICDVSGNISDALVNICDVRGNISDVLVNICAGQPGILPPRAGKHRRDCRCLQRMLPEGRAAWMWRVQGGGSRKGAVRAKPEMWYRFRSCECAAFTPPAGGRGKAVSRCRAS
jgi:hypothetical protein